jgi:hypothetical protein
MAPQKELSLRKTTTGKMKIKSIILKEREKRSLEVKSIIELKNPYELILKLSQSILITVKEFLLRDY